MQSEIARCLEDNELKEFKENVEAAEEVGYDLNTQYGKEVNNCMYIKLYRTSFFCTTVHCPVSTHVHTGTSNFTSLPHCYFLPKMFANIVALLMKKTLLDHVMLANGLITTPPAD